MSWQPPSRPDVQTLAIEIAYAITVTSDNENDWVARNGPESIYTVVTSLMYKVRECKLKCFEDFNA